MADYGYSGVGRTVTTELGNGLELDTGAVALGYGVFNRFGERTDLHYLDSVPSTALRYQYGRDEAGRILWSKVKQRDVGSDTRDNVRSWLYDYDDLGRLINAHMGKLNTGKSAIEADPDVPLARKLSWELDSLGHWAGGSAAAGSHILQDDLDGDGNYGESGEADAFFHDTADASNRLEQRDHENGVAVDVLIHDVGGDLVFDGAYFYQYDSLHRLIEVRQAGEFDAEDFDAETGRVVPDAKGQGGWEDYPEPGDVILRYFYDGLGRLIERRCPVSGSSSAPRIERYTYDGVRYFISSAFLSGRRFAQAVRGHWGIENSLRWVLDVTFDEDRGRTRHRRIADNLSRLRRFAISLWKRHPSEESIKSKSRMAGWSNEFLMETPTAKGI